MGNYVIIVDGCAFFVLSKVRMGNYVTVIDDCAFFVLSKVFFSFFT